LATATSFAACPRPSIAAVIFVPRLSRAELRQAIEGPASIRDARFATRLLDELLNEVADQPDQLPVLQHALLRTWDFYQERGRQGQIERADYARTGECSGAIEKQAEEAFEKVDQKLAERIFKSLTDTDTKGRRVRRSSSLGQLAELAGLGPDGIGPIKRLLTQFQEGGRHFVSVEDPVKSAVPEKELRVHLSHESLIRKWPRLSKWVDQERGDKEQYWELVRRSKRTGSLLSGVDLDLALKWKRELKPSSAWMIREGSEGDIAAVESFIAKSETAVRSARRRNGLVLIGIALALVVSSGFAVRGRVVANNAVPGTLRVTLGGCPVSLRPNSRGRRTA